MNILPIDTTNAAKAGQSLAGGLATTGGGKDSASGSFESVLFAASPVGLSIQVPAQSQKGGATLAKPDAQSGEATVSSTQSPVTSTTTRTERAELSDLAAEEDTDASEENVSKKQGNGKSLEGESDWSQLAAAQSLQTALNLAIPSVALVAEPSKSMETSTSSVAGVGAVGGERSGAAVVEKHALRFAGTSFSTAPTGQPAIAGLASNLSAQPQLGLTELESSGEEEGSAKAPIIALGLQGAALPDGESAGQTPAIARAFAGNSPVQPRLNIGASGVPEFGSVSSSQTGLPTDFPSQPEVQTKSQIIPTPSLEAQGRSVQQADPDMVQMTPITPQESSGETQKLEIIPNGSAADQKALLNGAGSSTDPGFKGESNYPTPGIEISGLGVRQNDSKLAGQIVPAVQQDRLAVSSASEQPTQTIPAGDSSVRISAQETFAAEPITTHPFIRRESDGDAEAIVRPVRFLASSADIRAITRPSKEEASLEQAIPSDTAPHWTKVLASGQGSTEPFALSELARKATLGTGNGTPAGKIFSNSMPESASLSMDSTAASEPAAPPVLRTDGAGQRASGLIMAAQFAAPEKQPARRGNSPSETGPMHELAASQSHGVQIQGRSHLQQNLAGNADMSGMGKSESLGLSNGLTSRMASDGEIIAAIQAQALKANRTDTNSLAISHETAQQAADAFSPGGESLETGSFSGTAAADQSGSLSSAEIELSLQGRVMDGNVREGLQVKKGLEGAPVKAEKSDDISPLRLPGRHLHAGASPVSAARIVVPGEASPGRADTAPVSEAVKPGVFRFPALDRGGMVDAQQNERMVSTKDNKPDIDLGGKNMPNFGKNDSPSRSALQFPAAAEPNRARQEFPIDRITELALTSNQFLDKAENSRGLAESAGSVRSEIQARLTERIWSAVETFRSAGSKDWVVRIRPEEGMELNLRMKMQENQLVIHARLDSGNWDVVAPSWRDLQAQLANRGVQLQPLEGSAGQGSFSQQHHNPMNSESFEQRQFTEEDRRNASDLREMDFRFGAEVSERKKPQLTTKSPLSGNGWESWA